MAFHRLAAAALFAALPAVAFAAPADAPQVAEAHHDEAQAEKPKKICRRETSTGSVMPKRVCRTAEQVEADAAAAARTREQMNRNRGM